MPELPEVEVLVQHLRPLIRNKRIKRLKVFRPKVLAPTNVAALKRALLGARFSGLSRRGKYLIFDLRRRRQLPAVKVIGHLGMTGRIFLLQRGAALPKHAAVVLDLGREQFVYEDQRYFGRFTLELGILDKLGPEPLSSEFSQRYLIRALRRSTQAIKIKLMDQQLVVGLGNIYASEALFRARISPQLPARQLSKVQVGRLRAAIRRVLGEAIRFGSTVPLNHGSSPDRDDLFYFGLAPGAVNYYEERLRVYDRAGQPCHRCGAAIERITQAARSTFFCPRCQKSAREGVRHR